MRGFVITLGSVLVLAAGPAAAVAQPTKTVTGSIAAISASSITVKVDGKDMTFAIDSDTDVVARGGTTKTRAAKAEGKGVTATDLLKTGQIVEVAYHEQAMHAASIREVSSVPSGAKAQTASGAVSAISGNTLTIKGAGGDMTFTVDENTTVSGSGVGTEAKKLMTAGKKSSLTEFLKEGDSVAVTYHESGGSKHASVIRITGRKKM